MCVHCESQLQAGWGQRLGMGHIIIRMYRRQSQKPTIVRNNGRARTQDWELRPTSHTRRPARDRCTSSTLIGWKRWSRAQVRRFTLYLRDQRSMSMHDGCNVYMDSYVASNGSCFMVTWIPHSHWLEKVEPVQVRCFTLRLRDRRSMWMRDGCKVYMDTYVASNGSCFMVTWTIFKNHLLEVGSTWN